MKKAGIKKDPVARRLFMQFLMVDLRLGKLQADAANAQGITVIKILNAAAARLLSELRRLAESPKLKCRPRKLKPRLRLAKTG